MSAKSPYNPLSIQKLRTDLGGTLNKNLLEGLVRLVQEFTKLIIETSSRIRELQTYYETINNYVYENK